MNPMPIGRWLDLIGASAHMRTRRPASRDNKGSELLQSIFQEEEEDEKPQPYARKRDPSKPPSKLR